MITNIITETKETKTFVLEFEDGRVPAFKPGQFLTLVFFTRHGDKRRSYSISSLPGVDKHLTITVKRVANGEFSRLLLTKAKIGDILFTSGISGLFLLPENIGSVKQYFFMAAGSGITPCFPMIQTILSKSGSSAVLIFSNRSEEDVIFHKQLLSLREVYADRLQIRFLFSNIFNVYKSRLSKWLLLQLMQEYLTVSAADARFYLCGPFEYMQMITITLSEIVPLQNILKENFSSLPRLVTPLPPDVDAHRVIVHANGQTHALKVKYPDSILSAIKKAKIGVPYSCEAGRCGSCAATCIKGKVWMAYNEVLTDDEIAKGRVLTCQGFVIGGDAEIVF